MTRSDSISRRGNVILEVKNLNVRFAHESGSLHAVRGIDFSVHAGEVLAIVGESGSGKSATAMAVMGLLPGSARVDGSVRLHGEQLLGLDDCSMSARRGKSVAMVFQDPLSALTPVYTVGEQIAESVMAHSDCSHSSAIRRAAELLDKVGIPDALKRVHAYPYEFSGGMRQRAMIAMAIANNPDLIIADEPTTALDVTIQAQILDVLQQSCNELDAALILITHDLGVVARLADSAIVMYAGKAVEKARVDSLFKTPSMPYTIGLLGSLPSLEHSQKKELSTIEGYPPLPFSLAAGCAFAPRCPLAADECWRTEPALLQTSEADQYSACLRHQWITDNSLGHTDLYLAKQPEQTRLEVQDTANAATGFVGTGRELLQLCGVKQHYPLYKGSIFRKQTGTVYAVDGIDLRLREGETLALVGESGCGKSTTALSILDLKAPTSGVIRVFDEDVSDLNSRHLKLAIRRKLQVVFQDPMSSLDPRMPVFDLIAEPLMVFDVAPETIQVRVMKLMSMVGLDNTHADRYPQQLSGGQCQRVCIARALAPEPRLLILDEPVSALDVSIRAGIINLLGRLKHTLGLSYLFIAHDLALVRHVADRVAVMYLGQIIETGPVDDVYDNPMHPYTRCLLSVVPSPDPDLERSRTRVIPVGDLPSPSMPPSGCRFHTRCPEKLLLSPAQQQRCVSEVPLLRVYNIVSDDLVSSDVESHQYACHFQGTERKT